MKLIVYFDINDAVGHREHRSWLVDADARMVDVLACAKSNSYLLEPVDVRIIDTRTASDMDCRLTKELFVFRSIHA